MAFQKHEEDYIRKGGILMQKRLVVIGGVAAGMSAAAKVRRMDKDFIIEVYTKEKFISYAGCGLPYYISNHIANQQDLIARTVPEFARQNISVFTECEATELNPGAKTVTIKNILTDEIKSVSYDKLLMATGARPFVPPLEGIDLKGVFTLRNIPDSEKIKQYIADYQPKKAIIVGAGYIGLEMVESLLEHDIEVTLIEQNHHIIPNMDEDMADIVTEYLTSKGVIIKTAETVKGFQGHEKVVAALTDQGLIETDFVLMSIGVRPNSEIAKEAGITLGTRGAIQVNNRMETNLKNIYAAGDCAVTNHLVSGQEVYIPMGTTANKQGRTAGENIVGGNAEFNGVLGTGIARIVDMEIARTGLGEKECQNLNIEYVTKTIKSKTIAQYLPHAGDIWVKLLVNKENRQLIGGQIVGFSGAGKRIDTIATAIHVQASIDSLQDMDLAYSPPFSPVWDPVLIAINQF